MMNKRMEKLNNAGVNTSKYFSFELPDGVTPGTTVKIMFDENGEPQMVNNNKENNDIVNQIIEDGYVRNTKLHRRFVMAQMFHMLNYKSFDGKETGFDAALRRYGYDYTFKMMLEEIKVLSKLEIRDYSSFIERRMFFKKEVVIAVCEDYMEKLSKYIDSLPTKKCKGVPYKRIKSKDIFVEDLNKKVYAPLKREIAFMRNYSTYDSLYRNLKRFINHMIKLPWDTKKSKAWIDAYKGEGAYYTCKNLIMFHGCRVHVNDYTTPYNRDESMEVLTRNLAIYHNEGWRMFAFMKKLIADNNFDFKKRMNEIYNK